MNKHLTNIKEKAGRHKTLIQNFSYLSALRVFNILIPLATYPYLVSMLGTELYGQVIFAQVVATYFGILIDFGFRLSATKDISIHRNDKDKLSEIISAVYIIKLILWIISFLLLSVLVFTIPTFKSEKLLYIFSFSICFNELLFPQWYFQGVEKMKYITIINLITRLIFLLLIFIIIKSESDYIYVPVLNGVGAFLAGMIGIYILFYRYRITLKKMSISKIGFYFKESFVLFISNLIISIKDRLNIIFVGSFLGMDEVTIYDLGIKISNLLMFPIDMINNVVYPKIVKEQNMIFMLRVAWISFFLVSFIAFLMFLFMPNIIYIFGVDISKALAPSRILLLSPIILSLSLPITRNCIAAFGKYGLLFWGICITSATYLVLIVLGHFLNLLEGIVSFVIIIIFTYFIELFYGVIVAIKYKLISEEVIIKSTTRIT